MSIRITHRRSPYNTLFLLFVLTLASCSPRLAARPPTSAPAPVQATGTPWPTDTWLTSSPEAQGMSSQKLNQLLDAVRRRNLNLHSLLIVRNGYLVSETYFGRYAADTRHQLYSCTKSFVSTLIGIAMDKGFIDRTDHRILDYFPDVNFSNLGPQKETLTIEDVLTMRTGLDWQEGDSSIQMLYRSPDWVKFMLDKPVLQPPGSQFNYCTGCSHLLTAVLQRATGVNPRDFAEQNLFKPLGIQDAKWDTDPDGIPIGGWGLQITSREMAKLGYLFLHNGQWNGEQIVSAGWVRAATQKHTDTDTEMGYGYLWWTYPRPRLGAYTALGLYGQTIFVIPAYNLIIVTTAQMQGHDEIFRLIETYILPAVQD